MKPETMSPLVVITGPTASGKSAFAMQIAKKYNGEIICADSRTVYKGMDIGTAKPSLQDQKQVRHHLLDLVDPDEPFTAADFKRLALIAINDIRDRGKLPVVVGGTGLYIDSVIFDYQFGAPAESTRRAELQALSVSELQQMCIDTQVPLPINTMNKRHLVRAIELSGVIQDKKRLRPDTIVVGISTEKDVLRERIIKRAHDMVKEGVLAEIKRIASKYSKDAEAFTGNIYRILLPVVAGELSLDKGLELSVTSDMQLAKRQLTWLKRNPYIIWGNPDQLAIAIEHFVQQNKAIKSIRLTD